MATSTRNGANTAQINVGVDAWDFASVSDDTICEMIASGPARTPCPAYTPVAA